MALKSGPKNVKSEFAVLLSTEIYNFEINNRNYTVKAAYNIFITPIH